MTATKTTRGGRLSVRMTQDFLDLCAQTAANRGQTLTEFVQHSMVMNLTRTPVTLKKTEGAA